MPRRSRRNASIANLVHKGNTRKNIPTVELQDFVKDDETTPPVVKYPRDPSLDPQLVWQRKDEQDSEPLTVPVVPIYIQEKIQPKAIIENVRAQAAKARTETGQPEQLELFDDFNGIAFEELIEFYQHEQNWTNRMILGDSLAVMTSLAEKEGLKGKVQMIYVDPPYGIKFGSNWQVSTRKRNVKDGRAEDMTRQPEQIRAFRDTWELGIHSYLNYLRDRFVVARDLLTETGSIFVQIGDENVHLVRSVLDEVFGSENFVAIIPFRTKTMPFGTNFIEQMAAFILWYAKSKNDGSGRPFAKYRKLFRQMDYGPESGFSLCRLVSGEIRPIAEAADTDGHLPAGVQLATSMSLEPAGPMNAGMFRYEYQGVTYNHPRNGYGTTREGMKRLELAKRLIPSGRLLRYALLADDKAFGDLTVPWEDTVGAGTKVFAVQTNPEIIKRCLLMTTDPGDLVLDPTCGSGTTAYVAEQWGRRWITIDTSRVALALARTRLMSARYRYYLLADSPEGVAKEGEITGHTPPPYETTGDVRKGFVYRHVPHVTLKSIANNPDITEGMALKEIDKAIARHADTETLYDRPYEDSKRIRVAGPFTVESLSPHRVLTAEEERPASEQEGQRETSAGFVQMILDNLRKAGVQNRIKGERLVFDRLEPFAGEWIQAQGEYTDKTGATKRVAVSIGPEHGTVGPEHVKEAAKEAIRGAGHDVLVICGFAFDAHTSETAKEFEPEPPKREDGDFAVAEEAKQYGKLPVLLTRMNPDLAMGDELLKKTGAGNLFMVFGEPDLSIDKQADGKIVVEIRGVDVYDPTTGQIRSNSTDDIMCWFIDTNYNGESFFVRHAYFSGADEPYEKLKRTLRAEIDEAAWSTLYSTRSFPFDPPETGKIALKVINHYGDEVLKVYEV